jgi:hypothetical protein
MKPLASSKENQPRPGANATITDSDSFLLCHPGAKVRPVALVLKGSTSLAYTANPPLGYAGLTRQGMTKCNTEASSSKHKTHFKNK